MFDKNLWDTHPMIVIWEMTRACALACRHCRASAVCRRDPAELSTQEAEAFIDQVKRADPKIFILTGGDPMFRPDLVHLVRYATERGLHVALSPSATPRFLKADLAALKAAGLKRMSLSLDGSTKESHDTFRGVRGPWDWTMRGLELARQHSISVQINTTFTRQNLGEFDQFVELLKQIQPEVWSVFQLVPTGRAKSEDLLTGPEMERLFERLAEVAQEVDFSIKTTEGMHYRRVAWQRWKQKGGKQPFSAAIGDGKGFVFVSHKGEVFPSGFLPMQAGNVRQDELIDVYRNSPLFKQLRDPSQLQGKCGRCEFKTLCGGSRARAWALTGDVMGAEPLCIYQPAKVAA